MLGVIHVSRDHPRIRGVHPRRRPRHPNSPGSSPHTRGALRVLLRGRDWSRIIPAYAGCTSPRLSTVSSASDHPRIRGVHPSTAPAGTRSNGSSPHTRGARTNQSFTHREAGIIPAYAGCTLHVSPMHTFLWDHPRIRGVHQWAGGSTRAVPGSSPHTRGAPN